MIKTKTRVNILIKTKMRGNILIRTKMRGNILIKTKMRDNGWIMLDLDKDNLFRLESRLECRDDATN